VAFVCRAAEATITASIGSMRDYVRLDRADAWRRAGEVVYVREYRVNVLVGAG